VAVGPGDFLCSRGRGRAESALPVAVGSCDGVCALPEVLETGLVRVALCTDAVEVLDRLLVCAAGLFDELPELRVLACEGVAIGDGGLEGGAVWIGSVCVCLEEGFEGERLGGLGGEGGGGGGRPWGGVQLVRVRRREQEIVVGYGQLERTPWRGGYLAVAGVGGAIRGEHQRRREREARDGRTNTPDLHYIY
jgi:hypothetical protein